MTDSTRRSSPSLRAPMRDLAGLLAHLEAALVVVDRMNERRAGTITHEARQWLAHMTRSVDEQLDAQEDDRG